MNFTTKLKTTLFEKLVKEKAFEGKIQGEEGLLLFLNKIWDLRNMPSEDERFPNAYGDIIQHTVNNFDWDLEELFVKRLKLFDDDEKFILFLELLVSDDFREAEHKDKYIVLINEFIETEGCALVIIDYAVNGEPIYHVTEIKEIKVPTDIKPNNIPIFVEFSLIRYSHLKENHTTPAITPALVLVYNNWDDFDYQTTFSLFYYEDPQNCRYIGNTKITDGRSLNISGMFQSNIKQLDKKFCSLGQNQDYYKKLHLYLKQNFDSVLFALRDASLFHKIQNEFEKTDAFTTSLIRDDEAERMLRLSKHIANGRDLKHRYNFTYQFTPPFSETAIPVQFNFSPKNEIPNRVCAIIGKNGTGKTQLISSLPKNILNKKTDMFQPNIPLFSQIIAVSYSIFDKFDIPKSTSTINYHYCGLFNVDRKVMTDQEVNQKFIKACNSINKHERVERWKSILLSFIEEDIVSQFIVEEVFTSKINESAVVSCRKLLSSGQNMILNIITDIVSNIRYDSLLLFDEPETHLHPNAISELINSVVELVSEFKSYCIIATHSPIVIQGIFADNVFVIDRDDDVASIRKIGIESFGENLSLLTDEVFGNKEIEKQYKKIIDSFDMKDKSLEDVISALEFSGLTLSLNARLYIMSRFPK